jgi:hypothetical protein
MHDLTLLNDRTRYHIRGEAGYFRYCYKEQAPRNTYKYTFKRIPQGNLRSKKLTLSEAQTRKRVLEEVTPTIDIEALEAIQERYSA